MRQPTVIVQEVAAGAGGHDDGQFAGPEIERVIAAVLTVTPGNLGVAEARRIGIDGRLVIVDADLPRRTAGRIGAGDHGRVRVRLSATGSRPTAYRHAGDRRQGSGW